jgi:Na+/proline symporter
MNDPYRVARRALVALRNMCVKISPGEMAFGLSILSALLLVLASLAITQFHAASWLACCPTACSFLSILVGLISWNGGTVIDRRLARRGVFLGILLAMVSKVVSGNITLPRPDWAR